MKLLRLVKYVCGITMALCLAAGGAVAHEGYVMYRNAIEAQPLDELVEEIRDRDTYTTFDELPSTYVDAVISVEDHRFYRHSGLDYIAIARAVFNDIKAMAYVEGGSTITQQLAKNLYFTQEKELTRKAAEVFMAFELERNYSKEEILELYVNSIYFGDGYYDVASASEGYFGKTPEELNDYEATLLAGVPNAPSMYAPTKNPDKAEQRRLQVVNRMIACGYITVAESETYAALAADY